MSDRAVVTLDALEGFVVIDGAIGADLAIVRADCQDAIIRGVLHHLDGLALDIVLLTHHVELSIEDLHLAVKEAYSDMVALVRDGDGISAALELEVDLLLASGHVPDGEHGIATHCDHLSFVWVHG